MGTSNASRIISRIIEAGTVTERGKMGILENSGTFRITVSLLDGEELLILLTLDLIWYL